MADTEKKSSGFLKAIGGIVASVIAGVLIFYITRQAPSPPVIEPTSFDGFVADSASNKLIPNASVKVTLGQNSVSQLTDPLGKYSVVLPSTGPGPNMGSVDVSATGYEAYTNTVELKPGETFAEITIVEIPPRPAAPTAAAPQRPAQPAAPPEEHPAFAHAQILVRPPPVGYVKAKTAYAVPPKP